MKKNPKNYALLDDEIEELFKALRGSLLYGSVYRLIDAKILNKTGKTCVDCKQNYKWCFCEGSRINEGFPCEDCGLRFCMCQENIDVNTPKNKIRKYTWDFAKEILNKKELKQLITTIYENIYLLKLSNPELVRKHIDESYLKKILKII